MLIYIIATVAVMYILPLIRWVPGILSRHIKFCCFVRPWCAHFVDSRDMGRRDGWAGMFFFVTESALSPHELPKVIAHEVRHVLHGIILGSLYYLMYSCSKTFRRWAEIDCGRAEKTLVYCNNTSAGNNRKRVGT